MLVCVGNTEDTKISQAIKKRYKSKQKCYTGYTNDSTQTHSTRRQQREKRTARVSKISKNGTKKLVCRFRISVHLDSASGHLGSFQKEGGL